MTSPWHWSRALFQQHVSLIHSLFVSRESQGITKTHPLVWNRITSWSLSISHQTNHNRTIMPHFNTLRPRPNRRHFADDIFKCIFENENEWISPRISLKFVPKVRINNIPALVQIMAWRRLGDKPLSEPMMVRLPTHISVTRPQWVNCTWPKMKHLIFSLNH